MAPEQQAGGSRQGLGPGQERTQGGRSPAKMKGSENILGCSPMVLQHLPVSSALPAPHPSDPAQPGMLSPWVRGDTGCRHWSSTARDAVPTGTRGIQAAGHRHPEGTAEHPQTPRAHRTEGFSIAFWHRGSPYTLSLPRAHWCPYSRCCGVPQKTGAASPPPQGQSEGPGRHAGDRADGVKCKQGPLP